MAISKRLRYEVLLRDKHTCRYCRSTDKPVEVDHVVPRALHGTDAFTNLTAACGDCNRGKSATPPDPKVVLAVRAEAMAWQNERARVSDALRSCRLDEPLMTTRKGLIMSEAQIRRHERDQVLWEASKLYDDDVAFWVLSDQARPTMHRTASPCISLPRFICSVMDSCIFSLPEADALTEVASEPWWRELKYNHQDDYDPSYWMLPAEFCDRCCESEFVEQNQELPEWLLEGRRSPADQP